MMQYSDELVDGCISYFKEDHNHDISREIANEYLESFACLFLAFAKPQETTTDGIEPESP